MGGREGKGGSMGMLVGRVELEGLEGRGSGRSLRELPRDEIICVGALVWTMG